MKAFMFVVLAALFVLSLNVAVAQQQDLIPFTFSVVSNPLAVVVGEVTFEGLNAGTCYQCPADPGALGTLIQPFTGNEAYTQGETEIDGDPFANVDVTFTLPTSLVGSVTGVVTLTYDGLSAAWGESGAENHFFNPQGTTTTMGLNVDGNAFIVLSANCCTPNIPDADDFAGGAVITVQYQ